MGKNLLNKVWDSHKVATLSTGQDQLFIGLHMIHEVTSPQAFGMLKDKGLQVLYPEQTVGTVDHIVPTKDRSRPLADSLAEDMYQEIEKNTKENGIDFYGLDSENQGIVHILGPELGVTQPGMTIACGDSHTSTHGAFGAIAFGIGTSQIRDIFASQTMALSKPKVRKIEVTGKLKNGVYAKDIILKIIQVLGVNGGIGYAYEFNGSAIHNLSMEERMTICNMSIEGGARVGYINPDQTTFNYLKGRKFSPENYDKAVEYWKSIASDEDAEYDDVFKIDASEIDPLVTYGINPGQSVSVGDTLPELSEFAEDDRQTVEKAYSHMDLEAGQEINGVLIDVAFIGSCTNGRISDFRIAADIVKGKKVADSVTALAVPGSKAVAAQAEKEGLDKIFLEAGFEWREPGCSMCLAMNPDKLQGRQLSASSSNRNFIGRQGSPTGRTLLMSPAMVAAAAVSGCVTDVRKFIPKRNERSEFVHS